MGLKRLIEETYDALTIDSAKTSASQDAGEASHIAYSVVASSASSPTGTAIQLQGSLDDTNFFDIGSAVNVTADGAYSVASSALAYRYYRLSYSRSSGSYIATTSILLKGEEV